MCKIIGKLNYAINYDMDLVWCCGRTTVIHSTIGIGVCGHEYEVLLDYSCEVVGTNYKLIQM